MALICELLWLEVARLDLLCAGFLSVSSEHEIFVYDPGEIGLRYHPLEGRNTNQQKDNLLIFRS